MRTPRARLGTRRAPIPRPRLMRVYVDALMPDATPIDASPLDASPFDTSRAVPMRTARRLPPRRAVRPRRTT